MEQEAWLRAVWVEQSILCENIDNTIEDIGNCETLFFKTSVVQYRQITTIEHI